MYKEENDRATCEIAMGQNRRTGSCWVEMARAEARTGHATDLPRFGGLAE